MDRLARNVVFRYILSAARVYYHGSKNSDLETLKPGEGTFALMGKGVYLYAKEDSAKRYGPYVYKVTVPTGLKIMPETFRLSEENVQTILRALGIVLDPEMDLETLPAGIYSPLWWFTDGWAFFNKDREETAEHISLFLNVSKGFDGMLAMYPNGGKVLVLWDKFERLKVELR
jgi:hypothetical protein